ncbi:MAG: VCBS repeat-containing protein [Bacteroidales bacterium]|nr:VCBS repeat-containing protein [Bacteroidales bacterium]
MKTKKLFTAAYLAVFLGVITNAQEAYMPDAERTTQEMNIVLPFTEELQTVTVEIIDDMVIFEGDIILGTVEEMEDPSFKSAVITGKDRHWRGGIIPFVIASGHPKKADIESAIKYINDNTDANLIARTNQADYIEIINGDGCWSYIGRQGGKQQISIGACSWGSTVHEISHAIGLYHEQSRADRDNFVTINTANIEAGKEHNFEKYTTGLDLGAYDFGSIMHYGATAFSKNGKPTIVSKVAGQTFGQRTQFSTLDINGVNAALNPDVWHDSFCYGSEVPLVGDFNGDGKDDVITFTKGTAADVFVALSNGKKFNGTGVKWHDSFCYGTEIPLVGDFNGDGKDDIATFTRGTNADVFVALSNGSKFVGTSVKWHDSFCYGTETPLVGDFNGDGKDDIVTFTKGTTADAFVALSTGSKFNGTSVKWHDSFCYGSEIPLVGDFNGDGKDDLVTFTRSTTADAFVALSTGSKFNGTAVKWHDSFCYGSEIPVVADLNKDGKDDIVTFTRGTSADVYIAKSNGSSFVGTSLRWYDWFASGSQIPISGDFNGDNIDDLIAFNRGNLADVFVALSGNGVPGQNNQSNDSPKADVSNDGSFDGEIVISTSLSVFPNPASSSVTVTFVAETSSISEIKLTNVIGTTVLDKVIEVLEGEVTELTLDLGNLETGIYVVELIHNGKVQQEKLTIK